MVDSSNRNRRRAFPLVIDLSEMDEKSRKLILKALAEEEARALGFGSPTVNARSGITPVTRLAVWTNPSDMPIINWFIVDLVARSSFSSFIMFAGIKNVQKQHES